MRACGRDSRGALISRWVAWRRATPDALYAGVRELPWEAVIAEEASIAVRASGTNAELRNTQFVALKVKDAICDRLAEVRGARPDVNPQQPDALP